MNTAYNKRKNLIYVLVTLDNLQVPIVNPKIKNIKEVVKRHISEFF